MEHEKGPKWYFMFSKNDTTFLNPAKIKTFSSTVKFVLMCQCQIKRLSKQKKDERDSVCEPNNLLFHGIQLERMVNFSLKHNDEHYLCLSDQPKRFDADSPATNVFFDDTNGQVNVHTFYYLLKFFKVSCTPFLSIHVKPFYMEFIQVSL